MYQGNTENNAALKGFAALLIQASCGTEVRKFQFGILSRHPFFSKIPKGRGRAVNYDSIYYFHDHNNPATEVFTRLIGWEITNQCLAYHMPVNFLRIVRTQGVPHICYYEVGVGRHLFMTGCFVDEKTRWELENLFSFLSGVYQLPIEKTTLQSQLQLSRQAELEMLLATSHQELAAETASWWAKSAIHRTFKTGELVSWNPHLEYPPLSLTDRIPWPDSRKYKITSVETLPRKCTCGLGDIIWISLHPEGRCALRDLHELKHGQKVSIIIQGETITLSGYYFDHFDI